MDRNRTRYVVGATGLESSPRLVKKVKKLSDARGGRQAVGNNHTKYHPHCIICLPYVSHIVGVKEADMRSFRNLPVRYRSFSMRKNVIVMPQDEIRKQVSWALPDSGHVRNITVRLPFDSTR